MTERQVKKAAQKNEAPAGEPRAVSTQVKPRCTLSRSEYVKLELEKERDAIVKAHIAKAKAGSVIHTKWLWGVAEQAPVNGEAPVSLAEMLMEELARRNEEV